MPLSGFLNFIVFVATAQIDRDKDKLLPAKFKGGKLVEDEGLLKINTNSEDDTSELVPAASVIEL